MYPQLNDCKWLYQQYFVEGLGLRPIAKEIGCSYGAVLHAFRHFNIKRRSSGSNQKGEKHQCFGKKGVNNKKFGKTKYPKLKDRKWLYKKYWIEGLSIPEIASVIGCCDVWVWRALKNCKIEIRILVGEKHGNYGKHRSEVTRRKASQTKKKQFQNPEFAKRMRKATAKRPTKPEKKFQEIVDSNTLPFKYTGDGGITIGNKCPDFIHNTKKIVVEVFGRAYHSPLFTFKKTMRHHQTYEGTIEHYKKHGYKCIVFWDMDLVEREDAEGFVLSILKKEKVI